MPRSGRPSDPTTRALGWTMGAVLVAGIGLLAVAEVAAARARRLHLLAFLVSAALLVGLGVYCLLLVRRAARERRLVEAERRLARVSVEEQTVARQLAEQGEAAYRDLIQLLGRELRGPLASIRGFATQLQEREESLPPYQRANFFREIRRQSNRLLRVIEDFTLAGHLAGEVAGRLVPLDVAGLVRDTVEEVDASPTHQVAVTVGEELSRVRGDPAELRQALLVLIEIAIRHSPAGGTVEVVALPVRDGVEIAVRDGGKGVAPETARHIREVLASGRADGSLGDRGDLDIGLFLVRSVAVRCHGEVRFDAPPGRASTFTLFLPSIPSDEEGSVLTPNSGVERILPE